MVLIGLLAGCQDYELARSAVRDFYTQTARDGAVDVLWVEDNSGTMYEEQVSLAEHADAFISVLATTSTEFRIGVVTTDMDVATAGQLVGPVLASDTPDLTAAFAAQVDLGAAGSREEKGLAAALTAASPAGPNAEFAAGQSALELVVYADEDDQSEGEVGSFLTGLAALRPTGGVRVNTIVGDLPDGCFSMLAAADPGARYVEAATTTGGARASICDPDTDEMLSRIAHAVLGLQTSFPLTKLPVLSSVEVRVDGALIPARDVDGWHYDGGANAVVFDGWAVPQAGATVEIRYWDWTQGTPPDTGG